ncbi:MAG TPA: NnrU family protein [Woeseiaceae bacterium]
MTILIIGLVVFFAGHCLPMFPQHRGALASRLGEQKYKTAFSIISAAGFVLILWGYSLAPLVDLWQAPAWGYRAAMLIMPVAFVSLTATYVPNNFRRVIRHPMLLAVSAWAIAHLLANGDLASLLLFGSFLAYAIIDMRSANRRGAKYSVTKVSMRQDLIVLLIGFVAFLLLRYFHGPLFGIDLLIKS